MSSPPVLRPWTPGDSLRALAVVVLWGLNFVVMKVGLQGLSPMLLGALRFAAASLPFLWWVGRPPLPWRYVLAYGLAQGLGQFGLLFWGLQLGMTAGMASVVMQMQAFFTLLLAAPFLGERARSWQWAGLGVALCGLLVIATAHGEGPGQMTLVGLVLTASAALMWAVSNIVVRLGSPPWQLRTLSVYCLDQRGAYLAIHRPGFVGGWLDFGIGPVGGIALACRGLGLISCVAGHAAGLHTVDAAASAPHRGQSHTVFFVGANCGSCRCGSCFW